MHFPFPITELVALNIDFEVFAPVIFIVLYFLSQFMGGGDKEKKKKQQEKKLEEARRKKRGPMDSAQDDADEEARARRIREEIQRKIAERRAAEGSGSGQQEASTATRRYDPNLPEQAQRRDFSPTQETPRPVVQQSRPAPAPSPVPAPRRLSEQEARVRPGSFEEAMAKQRVNLERASQARDEAFRQARSIERNVTAANVQRTEARDARTAERKAASLMTPEVLRKEILDELRDPESARKAIVLLEVLGPPIGARRLSDPADRLP